MSRRILTLLASLALLAACATSAAAQAVVVEYYHLDALGSVRVVTDQAGQVVARHDFLPFDEEYPAPQPTTKEKKLFTGHERDAETGLDYFGARYYRPQVGRFTTVDPLQSTAENLVDPQRWNRYAYVRNNPLKYTDPDGRQIRINVPGYTKKDIAESEEAREAIRAWVKKEFGESTAAFADRVLGFTGLPVSRNEVRFALGGDLIGAATAVTPAGVAAATRGAVGAYSVLRQELRGTGFQAHHLIEKRFTDLVGTPARSMMAMAVTPAEHQVFTNAWRSAFPFGAGTRGATVEAVQAAASEIYRNYPFILNALGR